MSGASKTISHLKPSGTFGTGEASAANNGATRNSEQTMADKRYMEGTFHAAGSRRRRGFRITDERAKVNRQDAKEKPRRESCLDCRLRLAGYTRANLSKIRNTWHKSCISPECFGTVE